VAASGYPQNLSRGIARASVPLEEPSRGLTQRALLNLLETFFRRPFLYLLPLVVLVAFGAMTALTADKEYRAVGVLNASTGSLLTEITDADRGFGYERPSVVTARNINQLMHTGVFLTAVIERAELSDELSRGFVSSDDVRGWISAEASGDTLVAVSATTPIPEWSQRLADATVDGFVEYVVSNDVADATVRIDTYSSLLADSQVRLDEATQALEQYLIEHPDPETGDRPIAEELQIARLRSAVTRAEEAIRSSESNLTDAQLARDVSQTVVSRQLRVLDEPTLPNAPVAGLRAGLQTVAIFFILGTALTIALVLLAAVLDRSVRTPTDISSKFGLEVLGVVPSARRS